MSEPQNRPGWWCPTCVEQVPPLHVTYEEKHYEEAGGCGGRVVPFPEHERLRDAVIKAANELERMRVEWMDAVDAGDLPDDELPEKVTEQTDRVCDAARALQEHERKASGQ